MIFGSIDQLDKADSPPIPESYIYLLGIQCLVSLCEGLASFAGPLYTSIVIQKPRAAGEAVIRAPPALDLSALSDEEPSTKQLHIVQDIIESGWPALLAALSFIISTNLSDELFVEVLASYQAMTNVSGMLGLSTPRDAFFTSLSKLSIPTRVVSSLDSYIEPQTPRTASTLSENLGLSGPTQPPGLSERNLACLKVFISSALFLAGSLGESWFGVLEALQNADYVLTSKGAQPQQNKRFSFNPGSGGAPTSRSVSLAGSASQPGSGPATVHVARHPLLTDLEAETLQTGIQRLFDASKNLDDSAFRHFVNALCRLSAEMVGMQSDTVGIPDSDSFEEAGSGLGLSPRTDPAHRRRASGIHIARTLVSGTWVPLVYVWLIARLISDLATLDSPNSAALRSSISTVSYIAPPMSPGIQQRVTCYQSSVSNMHPSPSECKLRVYWMKFSSLSRATCRLPVTYKLKSSGVS